MALDDARDLFKAVSSAPIPDWLNGHPPLTADLRAQVVTGKSRPLRRWVALKVVLIDESAPGRDRLGQVIMEQVADQTATGELYAADTMAGVRTDDAWRSALNAAVGYAKECGFGIAPGTDVRWSVRVLQPGEKWEDWEDTDENKPRPLKAGDQITGRSAGVAFFLGLFALAQREGAPTGWEARKVVESIVALATLPEKKSPATDDPLGTLGGEEQRKLEALRDLPEGLRVVVIFPATFTGTIGGRHESMAVTTVGGLATALRERCTNATRPDSLPSSRRATCYFGSGDEVHQLSEALRAGGLHVVTGPGGVGKTARVIEATAPLWKEGVFTGGRFWVDLYGAHETGRRSDVLTAERIVKTFGEPPADKFEDLCAQARHLLARHPSLVLLEGAETVPEGDIAALLELFPAPATVVWMTRRETDAAHPCLRGAKHHSVGSLSPADALELLCYAADRKVAELPATERPILEEIAEATERLPLLLGWAGEALRPGWGASPADYLAELNADPLGVIADPHDREMHNAGRFLRRSLARIVPTAEMPDLPAVAERLFAGLAAFDPSYGAPLVWWPLAAGLDTSRADGHRRFIEARRRLFGLGLVTRLAPAPEGASNSVTVYPVHALAGSVATALWRGLSAQQRLNAISVLCQAATDSLKKPLPPEWFHDSAWVARRSAEAAHYGHWLDEIDAMQGDPAHDSFLIDPLIQPWGPWIEFLKEHAGSHPLLTLKDVAWKTVCWIWQLVVNVRPEEPQLQAGLSDAWNEVGDVCTEREDWDGAERAFKEGMAINRKLTQDYPDVADFPDRLAISCRHLGQVYMGREDWLGAEEAFKEAMAIQQRLIELHAADSDLHESVGNSWNDLGRVCMAREDWVGAETAFKEAFRIAQKLADTDPNSPGYQRNLSNCWALMGDVCRMTQKWAGAEMAFKNALEIDTKQATSYSDDPGLMRNLSQSWDRIATVREARQDLAGAETALNNALEIDLKLVARYPEALRFRRGLSTTWGLLGDIRNARLNWVGAEIAFKNALEIDTELPVEHPDVAEPEWGLSSMWVRLAYARVRQQNWRGAESAFRNAIELDEKTAVSHPDPALQLRLFSLWDELGNVRAKQDDWAGAEVAFKNALEIHANRAVEIPEAQDLQRNLAVLWERLGKVRTEQDDWLGAEVAFKNEIETGSKLIAEHPKVLEFHEILSTAWRLLGDIYTQKLEWVDAETAFRSAIQVDKNAAAAHPDAADPQFLPVISWNGLASVAGKRGDDAAEEQALREALRLCEAVAERWLKTVRFEDRAIYQVLRLAQALCRLGRKEEAASLANRGLARAERLAALLQQTGAEVTERQKQRVSDLTKLIGPETDTTEQ